MAFQKGNLLWLFKPKCKLMYEEWCMLNEEMYLKSYYDLKISD